MKYEIHQITYEEILPMWELLHPGREHIKLSGMDFLKGATDWRQLLLDKYKVEALPDDKMGLVFFGAFVNNNLCGVNSFHLAPQNSVRSRGLFVLPEYRNKGIGQTLLNFVLKQPFDMKFIWSYPNKKALSVYLKAGFIKVSKFEKAEFGQNCYVIYRL